ncbi:PGR5-like protein 1A, chloroplastic [Stylosanthes scabra]|uniref:PGR5-like protein 1A, chloroplastic n=1 Tax=Stylosanthes scabra TaxID=79078 RepID=A0ABU6S9U7_9FABA|nr:PGR5-like protein 1A, chloroplastic [Stylosanthes scabra]
MASKLAFTLTHPRPCTTPATSSSSSSSSTITPPSLVPISSFSYPSGGHLIQFNGRHLCLRRRLFILSPKATADQQQQQEKVGDFEQEVVDSKILPYCSIDKKEKKSVGEMEQEFLQALQAFYYEGKAIMSNEEFDNLKEELMWEGSSVVMLSSDEQKFLEASMAYVSGNPIMNDKEYDELKMKLKMEGSDIVVEGPRCSLRSRKLPEPFSFIFTWFAAVPLIVWLALSLTSAIVKDFLILKGPCPNCGAENTSFFGTILSISNGGKTNNVKCSGCGTEMVFDSTTRLITLPEGSNA